MATGCRGADHGSQWRIWRCRGSQSWGIAMMSRILAERCAVLVMVITFGACGDSPTAPSGGLTGTWAGTMTGLPGVGTMRLEMAQMGPGLSGTFVLTIA